MKNLKGRAIFAQSGGPTAVINASVAGGVIEALKSEQITDVLCAENGIKGVLEENFSDMGKEDLNELQALKFTPAMAFGSVRYKMKDFAADDTDYKRLLEIFKKYDVRYFFYNGGNDSMDTCDKIAAYMEKIGYEINVIGIPKTIDNDLALTDHCPGYGSAAKYVATVCEEVALDAKIYGDKIVIILEIMGRNAGWLAAAASLSEETDLVYLPEVPFSKAKFISDVKDVLSRKNHCIVAVSEGIKYDNGTLVGEDSANVDAFGHTKLGGVCAALKDEIKARLNIKCKAIELNILQRCAAHCASKTDVEEAFESGRTAVKLATSGISGKMVAIKRIGNYEVEYIPVPLSEVANAEKAIPKEWIDFDKSNLKTEFKNYASPLIVGENKVRYENGLPCFAKLKKIKFKL